MKGKKPIKLYFFITVLIIIVLVHMGLVLKNYLNEKFPDTEPEESRTEYSEASYSSAIFGLAGMLLLLLIIIFIIFKVTEQQTNK